MSERLTGINRHLLILQRQEVAQPKVRAGLKDMLTDQAKLLEQELIEQSEIIKKRPSEQPDRLSVL